MKMAAGLGISFEEFESWWKPLPLMNTEDAETIRVAESSPDYALYPIAAIEARLARIEKALARLGLVFMEDPPIGQREKENKENR